MTTLYECSIKWLDDNSEVGDYLFHEYDDCPEGMEDGIFYFGLRPEVGMIVGEEFEILTVNEVQYYI